MSETETELRVFADHSYSELFLSVLLTTGKLERGIAIDCAACKRCLFNSQDQNFFDQGELEDLQAKQIKNPDRYIDTDGVDYINLSIGSVVLSCPCNYLGYLEDLAWYNQGVIADYLLARTQKERAKAIARAAEAEQLHAIMTTG